MAYPATIGPNGLQIPSLQDIIDFLSNGFRTIYGADINLNPNTADGQMIALQAQAIFDTYQQMANVYTTFDPDQATGINLDRDCAYNNVQRQPGSYTQQLVAITNSGSITLTGLDVSPNFPYTVSDTQGNQYQLITTITLSTPGTTALAFEATVLGPIQSAPNTITVPVTVLPGVTSINNPTGPSSIGVNEESDPSLRIRRQNSTALPSKGYLQGLLGALLDVDGVSYAFIHENTGSSVDGTGTAGHSIWCIVDITGSDVSLIQSEVAEAIYVKRNAGCGLRGSDTVNVPQVDGTTFAVEFDTSIYQNLWFRAEVDAITGVIDRSYIASSVLAAFGNSYGIGASADSSSIVAYIKAIAPNAYVFNEGLSTNGSSYGPFVTPSDDQHQFVIAGSSFISITA